MEPRTRNRVLSLALVAVALTSSGCVGGFTKVDRDKLYKQELAKLEAQQKERFEEQYGDEPPDFEDQQLATWRGTFMVDRKRFDADPEGFFSPESNTQCPTPQALTQQLQDNLEKRKAIAAQAGSEEEYLDVRTVMLEGSCANGVLNGPARWQVSYLQRSFLPSVNSYSGMRFTDINEGTFRGGALVSTHKKYTRVEVLALNVADPNSAALRTPSGDEQARYSFTYSASDPRQPGTERSLSFGFSSGSFGAMLSTTYQKNVRGKGGTYIVWAGSKKQSKMYVDAQGLPHGPSIYYSHAGGRPTPSQTVCFERGQKLETSDCAPAFDAGEPRTINPKGKPPEFAQPQLASWRAAFIADRKRLWADPTAFFAATPQTDCQVPGELLQATQEKMAEERAENPQSTYSNVQTVMLEGSCPGGALEGGARWLRSYQERAWDSDMGNYTTTYQTVTEGTFQRGKITSTRKIAIRVNIEMENGEQVDRYNFMYGVSEVEEPSKLARALLFQFGEADSSDATTTQYVETLPGGGTKVTQWKGPKKEFEGRSDPQGRPHGRTTVFAYDGDRPAPRNDRIVCFEHGKKLETTNCAVR